MSPTTKKSKGFRKGKEQSQPEFKARLSNSTDLSTTILHTVHEKQVVSREGQKLRPKSL
jgi:hypothetical protein